MSSSLQIPPPLKRLLLKSSSHEEYVEAYRELRVCMNPDDANSTSTKINFVEHRTKLIFDLLMDKTQDLLSRPVQLSEKLLSSLSSTSSSDQEKARALKIAELRYNPIVIFYWFIFEWFFIKRQLPAFMNKEFINNNGDYLGKIADFVVFSILDKMHVHQRRSSIMLIYAYMLQASVHNDGNDDDDDAYKFPFKKYFSSPAIVSWLFDTLGASILPTRRERKIALESGHFGDEMTNDDSEDDYEEDGGDLDCLRNTLSFLVNLFSNNPAMNESTLLGYKNPGSKNLQVYPFVDLVYNVFEYLYKNNNTHGATLSCCILLIHSITWNASEEIFAAFANHPKTKDILIHKAVCGGVYTDLPCFGLAPSEWDKSDTAKFAYLTLSSFFSSESGRSFLRGGAGVGSTKFLQHRNALLKMLLEFGDRGLKSTDASVEAQIMLCLMICKDRYLPPTWKERRERDSEKTPNVATNSPKEEEEQEKEEYSKLQAKVRCFLAHRSEQNRRAGGGCCSNIFGPIAVNVVESNLKVVPQNILYFGNPDFLMAMEKIINSTLPSETRETFHEIKKELEAQIKKYDCGVC